ncbi:hypothetical protein [Cupriavidus gilardii]|uniref:hypothetical protein n=1 Tax=Cupriavidus gilardii TaxID=82541 RepID=UPI0021C24122|nr:hypothetical protein [Cupriavidus gilardii]MCT9124492.1 hypothetical protein [Cupriavidus gilardii]
MSVSWGMTRGLHAAEAVQGGPGHETTIAVRWRLRIAARQTSALHPPLARIAFDLVQ